MLLSEKQLGEVGGCCFSHRPHCLSIFARDSIQNGNGQVNMHKRDSDQDSKHEESTLRKQEHKNMLAIKLVKVTTTFSNGLKSYCDPSLDQIAFLFKGLKLKDLIIFIYSSHPFPT